MNNCRLFNVITLRVMTCRHGERDDYFACDIFLRRFFVDLLAEPQHDQDARPAPNNVDAGLLGEFDRRVAFGPGLHPDMADP
jgi:hypothetical protein